MASKLIGRTVCPECGNSKAHVKVMVGEDGEPMKGKRHYRHCPDGDCGAQYFPRNEAQERALLAKTRAEGTPAPEAQAVVPAVVPAVSDTTEQQQTKEQRFRYVLGVKVPIEE